MITEKTFPNFFKSPLGKLYGQHLHIVGTLGVNAGNGPDAAAERMLTHMGIGDGIVAAARVLMDAETFEAFKRDKALDHTDSMLAAHLKNAFENLPDLSK